MGSKTGIAWCDATFNPVWGCAEVSPACDRCYARTWAQRFGWKWGVDAPRRLFGDKHWNEPVRWNRLAYRYDHRFRVFCASMADVFDNHPDWVAPRARLWQLIRDTPHLDWLLLTKRIGNAVSMLPADWGEGYANVWLGITVVTQAEVDRDVPKLFRTPARLHWLSVEPMIEAINVSGHLWGPEEPCAQCPRDIDCECGWKTRRELSLPSIDWVIVGGESGHGARPMQAQWVNDVLSDCTSASVPFFMKQGSQANWPTFDEFKSFPAELQVRQWPKVAR